MKPAKKTPGTIQVRAETRTSKIVSAASVLGRVTLTSPLENGADIVARIKAAYQRAEKLKATVDKKREQAAGLREQAAQHHKAMLDAYAKVGEILATEVKPQLPHGEFKAWIEEHCDFSYPTAHLYMKAAEQKSNGVEFSSLRQVNSRRSEGVVAPWDSAKTLDRFQRGMRKLVEREIAKYGAGPRNMDLADVLMSAAGLVATEYRIVVIDHEPREESPKLLAAPEEAEPQEPPPTETVH